MTTEQAKYENRIVRTPGVVDGKPVIQGTRIPVDMILERLAHDLDPETLFEIYPQLTQEDIKACFGVVGDTACLCWQTLLPGT